MRVQDGGRCIWCNMQHARDLADLDCAVQSVQYAHGIPSSLTALSRAQQVWLLGGPAALAERLQAALPALATADAVHVPEDDLVACYRTEMRDKHGEPSSGWIGTPIADCAMLIG